MTLALALAALIAGFTGSAHCAGMCGPIVSVFENSAGAASLDWQRRAAYHAGRLFTYITLGAIAGFAGLATLQIGPAEQTGLVLRLIASLALLLLGLRLLGALRSNALDAVGRRVWQSLSPLVRHVLPMTTRRRAFGAGILWGALPCGLLWGVAALAVGAGGIWQGALIMSLFWLGTLPALLTLGTLTEHTLRRSGRKLAGGLSVGIATFAMASTLLSHDQHAHPDGHQELAEHADSNHRTVHDMSHHEPEKDTQGNH